jgi:hypothetical protein
LNRRGYAPAEDGKLEDDRFWDEGREAVAAD